MTQELLPCPFCGGDATIKFGQRGWAAHCADRFDDCHVNGRTRYCNSPEMAAKLWNQRAGIPDPAAYVAAFEGMERVLEPVRDFLIHEVGFEDDDEPLAAILSALTAARQARGEG